MNLESELARASKLKCSSCGLKGAALGCFAKSCRRTYHVPCAVDIPDCRWDCVSFLYFPSPSLVYIVLSGSLCLILLNHACDEQDNFLMLCPIHKSIKFPSEKRNSRNCHSGEKRSLSSEM